MYSRSMPSLRLLQHKANRFGMHVSVMILFSAMHATQTIAALCSSSGRMAARWCQGLHSGAIMQVVRGDTASMA